MLLLGVGAGLPYAILTGTINAWFTDAKVEVSTIGVLSWIGLAYAFKFLWSPTLHRSVAPVAGRLGARRGWMIVFQGAVLASLCVIAASDPRNSLGIIALAALIGVIASASQDIVIDAWRIEIARDGEHLDALSAIYQFGYRTAAIIGGAGALFLAGRTNWNFAFWALALLMLVAVGGVIVAREPQRPKDSRASGVQLGARLRPAVRNVALLFVLAGWSWALFMLGTFMARTVAADPPPDARAFVTSWGPWIVIATVIAPACAAAALLWLERRAPNPAPAAAGAPLQNAADMLHRSIVEPLMDILGRMGWAAPLVLVLIVSYRFTDLVWGSFAYPFYLGTDFGALGHTKEEVALASKIVGGTVTILGIFLGGLALKAFGRLPCLVVGAALAAGTNLLFWDLAVNAGYVDGFLRLSQGYSALAAIGVDDKLARLIAAIVGENVAVGFASVVFVAYLSSIVSAQYAAVQYALLASLTMLIGTLGRGALGEIIEQRGFGYVFILTALLGLVAVAASMAEALRGRLFRRGALPETAGPPKPSGPA